MKVDIRINSVRFAAGTIPRFVQLMKRAYQFIASCLLNSILLLVILNFVLEISFLMRDSFFTSKEPFHQKGNDNEISFCSGYQQRWFDSEAYGSSDAGRVRDVLKDFGDLEKRGFTYQPWVGFSGPAFEGRRVHVDRMERRFVVRRTIPSMGAPEDRLQKDVYIFGGSTTFGVNVADEETWPSYLSVILDEHFEKGSTESVSFRVVNWGRQWYSPSEEVALLIDLLRTGHRPDVVVFMDGTNGPGRDIPKYSEELAEAFYEAQHPHPVKVLLRHLGNVPLIRFARYLHNKIGGIQTKKMVAAGETSNDSKENYFENIEMVKNLCKNYGCRPFFFLQPDPRIRYDVQLYRSEELRAIVKQQSPHKQKQYAEMRRIDDVIDLSGLFYEFGEHKKAIIDDVHYSPSFNQFLAAKVYEYIKTYLERDLKQAPIGSAGKGRSVHVV
jgi:lysophospholipase L1-like esterase